MVRVVSVSSKRLILGTTGRFISYEVRPSPAQPRWAYRFVCIDHNLIFRCFFECILMMVVDPLTIMVFPTGDDIADIACFCCIITIIFHELIRLIYMTLVISYRARSFMVHNHLHPLALRVGSYFIQIKIRIRRYKIKDIVFRISKPIFPTNIPSFYEYSIKAMCRRKVDVALYVCRSRAMLAVWFHLAIVGFSDKIGRASCRASWIAWVSGRA